MKEEWRTIPNYENYLISNKGRIYNIKYHRELTRSIATHGYLQVGLSKNGVTKLFLIHRLVMKIFNPIEDYHKYDVNHIDGNKQNNNLDNLEWISHQNNVKYNFDILQNTKTQYKLLVTNLITNEKKYYITLKECSNDIGISCITISKYVNLKQPYIKKNKKYFFKRLDN